MIIAYMPTWTGSLPENIHKIHLSYITHINIAFLNYTRNAGYIFEPSEEDFSSFIQIAHSKNIKVSISIGGGVIPDSVRTYYSDIQNNKNERMNFVKMINDFILKYNLDGLDVDIENDLINYEYNQLIYDIKNTIPKNIIFSAALNSWNSDLIAEKTLNLFDYITVMSYDHTGPWKSTVGQHSSYENALNDLDYFSLKRNIDCNKLVLGVPFYGYDFSKNNGEYTPYNIIVKENYAANNEVPFIDNFNMLFYNGINTISKKARLAKKYEGIAIWEITQDCSNEFEKYSLLKAIHENYR